MRKILKQIMLEYIRLFVPVYPIDEELLEFNETEDKYELYYHKLNLSAEYDEQSERIVSKIFEGIDQNDIVVTIKTIMQMEKNLESI